MFGTRNAGGIYTSVQLHPIKLLVLGVALIAVGLGMLSSFNILWIVLGVVLILIGFRLSYVGVRQVVRGARTFLS